MNANASGEARLEGVVVVDSGSDGLRNEASGAWTFEQGNGNQGFWFFFDAIVIGFAT